MLMRSLAAASFALVLSISAAIAAGSPSGTFNVQGTNPGGTGKYAGTVTVTPTGTTFRVTWRIGSQTITGTGIWVDEKFSIGYPGNSVAVMTDQGGGNTWGGYWANGTDTRVGTERWTR